MREIIFITAIFICAGYAFLLLPAFLFAFSKQKFRKIFIPKTFISILIPVRNEADEINACIESILALDYPSELFEIIIIDDHSTDETKLIAEKFAKSNQKISVLQNDGVGKKSALTLGVKNAKSNLIVTTDGDCIVPPNWLNCIAEIYENENPVFIAGPVAYKKGGGIFRDLLQIEQIVLQIISGGMMKLKMPLMCSGANLAYRKDFFLASGGYENDAFASGDDMMLMLKAEKLHHGKLRFIKSKNAIVKTKSAKTFREALQQRSRWLSKFSAYKSPIISFAGIIVFLMNAFVLLSGIAAIVENSLLMPFISALVGKTIVDFLLLSLAVPFFGESRLLIWTILGEIFYPVLAIAAVVVRFSGSYGWKDRKWKT